MNDCCSKVSRRDLLTVGSVLTGGIVASALVGPKVLASGGATAAKVGAAMPAATPQEALQRLKTGNERFVAGKSLAPRREMTRLTETATGQNPFAAFLSCADSRVPVEILFDEGFGDLFVCRVAGNAATPEEIGSLEFGTAVLGAKVLVVMGHTAGGAVKATLENAKVPGSIDAVLGAIRPAMKSVKDPKAPTAMSDATIANVRLQTDRLTKSPVISGLIKEKKLAVTGAVYDIATGRINWLDTMAS